jgi:uncharacterized GH25 family protein
MRKIFLFSLAVLIFSASQAQAIDFWAGVEKALEGEPAQVFQGMGDFPKLNAIKPEAYAQRYQPISLVGPGGEVKLKAGASGESYVSLEPLTAGSYYVLAASLEGFASRTPDGVVRKSKAEDPTATACSFGGNFGKTLVNVRPRPEATQVAKASQIPDQAKPADANAATQSAPVTEVTQADQAAQSPETPQAAENPENASAPAFSETEIDNFVIKPMGQKLEIVPQINPQKIKVGEKLPVKVLFDGEPLVSANVGAFFAGFTEGNKALAFSEMTNEQGLVEIIPLRPGEWLAKVSKSGPYSDAKVCDRETYATSFVFTVFE